MFCSALLLAFHYPAQAHIIKSEIQVIGIIIGLVSLHFFLVTDLLSGLEHDQQKQTWSTGVLWALHLLNLTINQCLGNTNGNEHLRGASPTAMTQCS